MTQPPKLTTKQQISVASSMTQTAAAWLVGCTARTFRDQDAPRNRDGSYNAAAILEWVRSTANGDDPLLAGGDSPNLERYRAAKAQLAEMDAAERQGQLVNVDQLTEWWAAEVVPPIRRAIDTLQLRFGPEAAQVITEAIDRADCVVADRRPSSA